MTTSITSPRRCALHRQSRRSAVAGAVLLALLACAGTAFPARAAKPPKPTSYFPGEEWRRASPASQKIDAARIEALVSRFRDDAEIGVDSLLIVRNGYLVVEEYFNEGRADLPHTLQSVSKSITSLLVGAAVQQGYLAGADQPVLELFPEYQPVQNVDDRKLALTVRDLLTMRTGFDWSEMTYAGSPLQELNTCQCDWLRFMLDYPMGEQPGTRWEYCSGGTILLGGVLRASTGMAVDDFAREALFEPLGISQAHWYEGLPTGMVHTGGGLWLRSQDMARVGYLVLRKGRWGTQQIVSEPWLRDSTKRWTTTPWYWAGRRVDYGYKWWLLPLPTSLQRRGQPRDIYAAAGNGGQFIFVVPAADLVVVVTGEMPHMFDVADHLYDDILPAMR